MNAFGLANNTGLDAAPAKNDTSLSGFVTVQDAVRTAKEDTPTRLVFVDEYEQLMTDHRAKVAETLS